MILFKPFFKGLPLLRRGSVVRGASTVAIGTAIGQGIVTIASPAITRLYTTVEIGYFATFTALTNFFVAFVCMRLEQVILIADGQERRDVVASCLASILAVVFTYVMIVLLTPPILINVPTEMRNMIAVLGGGAIGATGLYQVCQYLALRDRRMSEIARYQVMRALIATVLQLGLAIVGLGFIGLAGGQVIGLVIAVLPLIIVNRNILSNVRFVSWSDIRRVVSKFKSFPLYGAPQSLLQAATFSMPVLIIGSLFGTVEAAIFWLGFRVFGLPSQVVIESVRASLLSNFSEKIRERRDIVQLWKRSSVALGALMLPLPLVLALFGHRLFGFIFGQEWTSASTVTMILSFAWIAQNARVPSVVVLQLTGNQKLQLIFEGIGTVGRALALSSALLTQSFYTVLSLFVIVNLLQSVVTIWMTLHLLRSFNADAEFTREQGLLRGEK